MPTCLHCLKISEIVETAAISSSVSSHWHPVSGAKKGFKITFRVYLALLSKPSTARCFLKEEPLPFSDAICFIVL